MPYQLDSPFEDPSGVLSMKAAAAHAGVSVSTIRRRKDALIAAGATVTSAGWAVPLQALNDVFGIITGPLSDTPLGTHSDTRSTANSESDLVAQLRAENARLWHQVEQQARTIERQAEAHAVISAQLTKMNEIESGYMPPGSVMHEQPAPRQRWWKRARKVSS